jgi:hypothetical protein
MREEDVVGDPAKTSRVKFGDISRGWKWQQEWNKASKYWIFKITVLQVCDLVYIHFKYLKSFLVF